MPDFIRITGARVHNLKGVDVEIPKNKLTVITGVSGSGKSSLAFDTLYEEGKRRYLMFSDTSFMVDAAPTFESIDGLSPAVAVEQRVIRQSNPRSTVGTRTKIGSLLAVLFAACGERGADADGAPLDMAMFQRNSPRGMCVKCLGSGMVKRFNEDAMFEDGEQRVDDVMLGLSKHGHTRRMTDAFYEKYGIERGARLSELTGEQLNLLKYGDGGQSDFMGFIPWALHIISGAFSTSGRLEYLLKRAGLMYKAPCPKCGGTGLGEAAAHTAVSGKTITELETMYIRDLLRFFEQIAPRDNRLIGEIKTKLRCMADVGLEHLSLSRPLPTLSGGEIQRLFLASYIIAEMDSIIFVFDEPTVGLHETEKARLIDIIRSLIAKGNTVVAVEHDENFIRAADYIIDLGPHAGEFGGERIFQGSPDAFINCERSQLAPYLSGKKTMPVKTSYRPVAPDRTLTLRGCSIHNLRGIDVSIPLGLLVGVAGVSGSGKSSLVADTLVPALKAVLKNRVIAGGEDSGGGKSAIPDGFAYADETGIFSNTVKVTGCEHIKKCVVVDQRPIGRSRTSCPATYTGMFDRVRALFARESGLSPGYFSINARGGCRACGGDGELHYHVGMGNFVHLPCETCGGTGFTEESLSVTVDGKNIRDILNMSVRNALGYFKDKDKPVYKMLLTLERVGMGYIGLGQKTPTISGGEAQRVKLAAELGKTGKIAGNIYILDEPTTGLSFSDIERLIRLMDELTDNGATVIVTEHDPSVLSNCDYIIEMGPGGGGDGGLVIAEGAPVALKRNADSVIGRYLR